MSECSSIGLGSITTVLSNQESIGVVDLVSSKDEINAETSSHTPKETQARSSGPTKAAIKKQEKEKKLKNSQDALKKQASFFSKFVVRKPENDDDQDLSITAPTSLRKSPWNEPPESTQAPSYFRKRKAALTKAQTLQCRYYADNEIDPILHSCTQQNWTLKEYKPLLFSQHLSTVRRRRMGAKAQTNDSCVEICLNESSNDGSQSILKPYSETRKFKLWQFHENFRPPYFGTFSKKSDCIKPRNPFRKDPNLDYEYDSDAEWEEEEPGESLSGCEDQDDLDGGKIIEDYSDDDGFVVLEHQEASDNLNRDKSAESNDNFALPQNSVVKNKSAPSRVLKVNVVGICLSPPVNDAHKILDNFPIILNTNKTNKPSRDQEYQLLYNAEPNQDDTQGEIERPLKILQKRNLSSLEYMQEELDDPSKMQEKKKKVKNNVCGEVPISSFLKASSDILPLQKIKKPKIKVIPRNEDSVTKRLFQSPSDEQAKRSAPHVVGRKRTSEEAPRTTKGKLEEEFTAILMWKKTNALKKGDPVWNHFIPRTDEKIASSLPKNVLRELFEIAHSAAKFSLRFCAIKALKGIFSRVRLIEEYKKKKIILEVLDEEPIPRQLLSSMKELNSDESLRCFEAYHRLIQMMVTCSMKSFTESLPGTNFLILVTDALLDWVVLFCPDREPGDVGTSEISKQRQGAECLLEIVRSIEECGLHVPQKTLRDSQSRLRKQIEILDTLPPNQDQEELNELCNLYREAKSTLTALRQALAD